MMALTSAYAVLYVIHHVSWRETIMGRKVPRNITDNVYCLVPECTARARTRGLCITHNAVAHRLVTQGHTSWSALELAGKALQVRRQRHNTISYNVTQWFLGNS
ncbi:hypothetical protein CMI37_03850 [Candidatus Pacearchaeota archaeon]|nr:hypothetical protein [Candidatus Pacearchaeota archaeon]